MRRITAGFFISLDGVVEAPYAWHFPYLSEEVTRAVADLTAGAEAMLFGRRTYQEFARHWAPRGDDPLAARLAAIPKYVASTTLERVDWANSTLLTGDPAERIAELKRGGDGRVAVAGSAVLVRWLLAHGLLDELTLLVHPVVIGTGARLFEGESDRYPLALTRSAALANGTLHVTYRPA
ncbi:dihydrofolate reductase family protein [Kitasatospora sp. NPDC054939]